MNAARMNTLLQQNVKEVEVVLAKTESYINRHNKQRIVTQASAYVVTKGHDVCIAYPEKVFCLNPLRVKDDIVEQSTGAIGSNVEASPDISLTEAIQVYNKVLDLDDPMRIVTLVEF